MTKVDKLGGRKTLEVGPILEELEKDRVKKSVDLVDLFGSFGVELVKKGAGYMGKCPFHEDSTPSLSVDREKGLYNCFGCGEAGDAFTLVEKMQGTDFKGALEYLKGPRINLPPRPRLVPPSREPEASPVPEVVIPEARLVPEKPLPAAVSLADVCAHYERNLAESDEAKAYLASRGLTPEIAKRFHLGYSNGKLGELVGKEAREELAKGGIFTERGSEHFAHSITVPLLAESGAIVGFYGRKIDDREPHHLYMKGKHRGLVNGKAAKAYRDGLILTESIIDALSLVAQGFENIIPCYGTGGFTEDHLEALAEGAVDRVVVAFDADEAGRAGADRLVERLRDEGIKAATVNPPSGKDWNDCLVAKVEKESIGKLFDEAFALATAGAEAKEGPLVVKDGKKYTFTFPDVAYRVVIPNENFGASLRSNIRAETRPEGGASPELFLDNCDLYSSRSRASFAAGFSRLSGFEAVRIERDLLAMVERFEAEREKRLDEASPQVEAVTPEGSERDEAMRFLKSPELFLELEADMDALGYVGERVNKLVVYLAGVSRLLPKPLSIYIQAGSGSGKSYLIETVRKMLPPESVLAISSFSDQALNYMRKEDFAGKVMLLGEAIHNDLVEGQIRQMQSEGEISRLVVVKDPKSGELESKQVHNAVRLAFMMSSTALYLNPENASRCLVLHTDESREQTERILELQRNRRTFEGYALQKAEIPRIIEKHQAAQRLLAPVAVFNPLAPYLRFPTGRPTMRRAQDQFLTLLETVAMTRQFQKKHAVHENPYSHDEVEGIEVDLDDYGIAHTLFRDAVLVPNANEVPSGARLLYEALRDMAMKRADSEGLALTDVSFIQRDARELTELGIESVKKYLRALVDFEYLEIVSGWRHGTRFSYRFRDAEDPDLAEAYLPSIDELASLMNRGIPG
jgi:hypothetical protein